MHTFRAMEAAPITAADLQKIGISRPYAHQIVSGARDPALPLALRIHRELGAKFGLLKRASDAEIEVLRDVAERQEPVA